MSQLFRSFGFDVWSAGKRLMFSGRTCIASLGNILYVVLSSLIFLNPAKAADQDIVLGQIASLSNPSVSDTSRELQRGYQIYFSKINGAGGVGGRKIRLIEKDDGYDAQKTLAMTKELIEKDGVLALVGYLGTQGPALLAKDGVLTTSGIAMIAPASGTTMVLSKPNMFPVRATYESEIAEIAQHAHSMGLKNVAMMTWTAGAGPSLAKTWPAVIERAGLKLSENQVFDISTNATVLQHNIDTAIEPIANVKPDAVFLIASGNALYAAVKTIRAKLSPSVTIYTVSAVNWKELIKKVGLKSATGVIVTQCVPYPYSPILPIVKEYLYDIKAAGQDDVPSYYGLEGYLGAVITIEALRRAGPNITRAKILESLNHMGRTEIGGFEINYSAALRTGYVRPDVTMITSHGALLR